MQYVICAVCVHYDHCYGIELDFEDFDILTKKESESVNFRLTLSLSATSFIRHRGKIFYFVQPCTWKHLSVI